MGQTEEYLKAFEKGKEINMSALPEPLQREYHREVEDLIAIQQATSRRRQYEERRIDQV
jgi:hypothetical protein